MRAEHTHEEFTGRFLAEMDDQQPSLETMSSFRDARHMMTQALNAAVLAQEKYSGLSDATKEAIETIGMQQSSFDLRHFGGCEAILNVELVPVSLHEGKNLPKVIVTIDPSRFDDLNRIRITESSTDLEGNNHSVTVGIGEYQIWRASEAFRSIFLASQQVALHVQDIHGNEIPQSIQNIRR